METTVKNSKRNDKCHSFSYKRHIALNRLKCYNLAKVKSCKDKLKNMEAAVCQNLQKLGSILW